MHIQSFSQLEKIAAGANCRIGVVMADEPHVLQAVHFAAERKLIRPVLIGNGDQIVKMWKDIGGEEKEIELLPAQTAEEGAALAAQLARSNQLDGIMKGRLETGVLMKTLVKRETGITEGRMMSLIGMFESPYYHKLFAITDVGLMTYPNLEQKQAEIQNAVSFFHDFGIEEPKVAVLCAVEKPNPKMPETMDAVELTNLAQQGIFGRCIVEGPISYDLAMTEEAAAIKGYDGRIRGDADILLVPNIVAGNVLAKGLTCTGGAKTGGIVVGGKVPVILVSRSASTQDKYHAILLTAAKKGLQSV